jgi:hypothetical protein
MRISPALVDTPAFSTPARAEVYPTLPCRVFVDTDDTQMWDGVALICLQIIHANDPGVSFKTSRELSHYVIE